MKTARESGLEKVPVIALPYDDAKARTYMLAGNRLQEEMSLDFAPLADLLLDLDQAGVDLDLTGFTLFRDLETGQVDAADPLEIKTAYDAVFADHQRRLRNGTTRYGIEFHSVEVSENWEDNLASLLRMRSRRT